MQNRFTMSGKIFLSYMFMILFACGFSARAVEPQPVVKSNPEWMDPDNMTFAAIQKTNPFQIVPAAGVEILEHGEPSIEEPSGFQEALAMFEEDSRAIISDMIGYAKGFIGTRYRRGGKSPKGFDCSGFTSYVFDQFGIKLNNNSGSQFTQGTSVDRQEVEPGDLVFFKGSASRSSRVGHVGIAIDNNPDTGEITFIHAATSGGIRIDKVSTPYYRSRYLGARRVIE